MCRKDDSLQKDGPPVTKELRESGQGKAAVQDFFPPGRRDTGCDVSDGTGQPVVVFGIHKLGNNGFLGVFQDGFGQNILIDQVRDVEEPATYKISTNDPPEPFGLATRTKPNMRSF